MPDPEQHSDNRLTKGSLMAGLAAGLTTGLAASVCCLGPLLLLTLGISGSWISTLSALAPYRPLFIALTLLFLGLAFRKLYLVPPHCAVDTPCAQPARQRKQRLLFWLVAVIVLAMVTFPWYAPLFLDPLFLE